MKVYVAASAAEIDRAEAVTARLRGMGIEVTSTWPVMIRERQGGVTNPRGASRVDRRAWSDTDLSELDEADVLLFLAPEPSGPTRGAWVELGYARATRKPIISSGDTLQSIFCAMGLEFATDDEALSYLEMLGSRRESKVVLQ